VNASAGQGPDHTATRGITAPEASSRA